jgi:hypothetical protein
MKKLVFTVLFMFSGILLAQEKYLIYFADKGNAEKALVAKTIEPEKVAEEHLSKRSIERRKRNLGEKFFTIEDLPLDQRYLKQITDLGIKIENKLKWFNAVSAYLTHEQRDVLKSLDFITKIDRIRQVKSIESKNIDVDSNQKIDKSSSSHTFNYGISLTQNELSDIPQIHDMGITGENVIIGLLDTGFDWERHLSLKDRTVIAEYDFVYKDGETANDSKDASTSQHNHGTSVFSIIGGFDQGNLVGPAFNSQYILAKTEFVPTETHVEEDNYAAALEWMDSIGVDITSSSLGYSEFDAEEFSYSYQDMNGYTTIVTQAAELAFDRGILVVTSAGNEGNSSWKYITAPGDGINTMTIGAVTSSNIVTSFSSEGPTYDGRLKPEIVAMGASVVNARASTESSYNTGNGTSYSAPIAAGIAGMLLSAYPHLTNRQMRSILIESGDNTENPNNEIGYGLLSALKAVTFPNLKQVGDNYQLNKIFDPAVEINATTVELTIVGVASQSMIKNGNVFYTELPALIEGKNYEFYFTFKDVQNNEFRVPSDNFYNFEYGRPYIDFIVTGVEENGVIQNQVSLSQNYPNPFNPSTKIDFSIPADYSGEKVTLKIYDILGTEVRSLVNETKPAGNYSIEFLSDGLTSGVYFYQLRVGKFKQTKKLTILK